MKKILFSAIAMIAFSVGSMANKVALEESLTVVDCYQVATDVVNDISSDVGGGLSHQESYELFSIAYDICVGSGECDNCLDGVTVKKK